jgi:hypothetical protein
MTYNLGVPKDEPLTGTIIGQVLKSGREVEFGHDSLLPLSIKRTSAKNILTLAYQRRAATFSMTSKKGSLFMKKEVIVGTATVPLADLLNGMEAGGVIPITRENDKGKHKEVPGALAVKLVLRTPVLGPCVSVSEQRMLVLDPWPVVVSPPPANASPALVPSPAAVTAPAPSSATALQKLQTPSPVYGTTTPSSGAGSTPGSGLGNVPTLSPATAAAVSPGGAAAVSGLSPANAAANSSAGITHNFDDITAREKQDPLGVEFLVSNDVLDDELARTQEELASCKDPDAKIFVTIRVQIVQTKLALLVQSVQEEKISLAEYLDIVRDRIARDQRLVLYFKYELKKLNAQPDKDKEEMHEVLKNIRSIENRISIMQNEVKGAEEGQEG